MTLSSLRKEMSQAGSSQPPLPPHSARLEQLTNAIVPVYDAAFGEAARTILSSDSYPRDQHRSQEEKSVTKLLAMLHGENGSTKGSLLMPERFRHVYLAPFLEGCLGSDDESPSHFDVSPNNSPLKHHHGVARKLMAKAAYLAPFMWLAESSPEPDREKLQKLRDFFSVLRLECAFRRAKSVLFHDKSRTKASPEASPVRVYLGGEATSSSPTNNTAADWIPLFVQSILRWLDVTHRDEFCCRSPLMLPDEGALAEVMLYVLRDCPDSMPITTLPETPAQAKELLAFNKHSTHHKHPERDRIELTRLFQPTPPVQATPRVIDLTLPILPLNTEAITRREQKDSDKGPLSPATTKAPTSGTAERRDGGPNRMSSSPSSSSVEPVPTSKIGSKTGRNSVPLLRLATTTRPQGGPSTTPNTRRPGLDTKTSLLSPKKTSSHTASSQSSGLSIRKDKTPLSPRRRASNIGHIYAPPKKGPGSTARTTEVAPGGAGLRPPSANSKGDHQPMVTHRARFSAEVTIATGPGLMTTRKALTKDGEDGEDEDEDDASSMGGIMKSQHEEPPFPPPPPLSGSITAKPNPSVPPVRLNLSLRGRSRSTPQFPIIGYITAEGYFVKKKDTGDRSSSLAQNSLEKLLSSEKDLGGLQLHQETSVILGVWTQLYSGCLSNNVRGGKTMAGGVPESKKLDGANQSSSEIAAQTLRNYLDTLDSSNATRSPEDVSLEVGSARWGRSGKATSGLCSLCYITQQREEILLPPLRNTPSSDVLDFLPQPIFTSRSLPSLTETHSKKEREVSQLPPPQLAQLPANSDDLDRENLRSGGRGREWQGRTRDWRKYQPRDVVSDRGPAGSVNRRNSNLSSEVNPLDFPVFSVTTEPSRSSDDNEGALPPATCKRCLLGTNRTGTFGAWAKSPSSASSEPAPPNSRGGAHEAPERRQRSRSESTETLMPREGQIDTTNYKRKKRHNNGTKHLAGKSSSLTGDSLSTQRSSARDKHDRPKRRSLQSTECEMDPGRPRVMAELSPHPDSDDKTVVHSIAARLQSRIYLTRKALESDVAPAPLTLSSRNRKAFPPSPPKVQLLRVASLPPSSLSERKDRDDGVDYQQQQQLQTSPRHRILATWMRGSQNSNNYYKRADALHRFVKNLTSADMNAVSPDLLLELGERNDQSPPSTPATPSPVRRLQLGYTREDSGGDDLKIPLFRVLSPGDVGSGSRQIRRRRMPPEIVESMVKHVRERRMIQSIIEGEKRSMKRAL